MKRVPLAVAAVIVLASPARSATPKDDRTFRPTVVIRKGSAQGSGTIISSSRNATLVLTAAHVVEGRGPLIVELHRYNLGVEQTEPAAGWPRLVGATVVGSDSAADVAVLRVQGLVPLPFVARLSAADPVPPTGALVTSIGIDKGTRLLGWSSRVVGVEWFEFDESGTERMFVVTERPPEHGRSGGGLFLNNGDLVGVCVGHAEIVEGRRSGLFSSVASVRGLLRDHKFDEVLNRSSGARRPPSLTPTQTRPERKRP